MIQPGQPADTGTSTSTSATAQAADASHPGAAHHTGGCACGAVRYRTLGLPLVVSVCHCRFCQLPGTRRLTRRRQALTSGHASMNRIFNPEACR